MAPENTSQLPVAKDFDVLMNKINVELARRKQLFAPYIEEYAKKFPPRKSQEQLDAEDSKLFLPQPLHLGLGCPVPKDWQPDGEVTRKKALGQAILGKKFGLQASKQRDAQEKAVSMKRGLDRGSSDEDEGRSALGKIKKVKASSQISGSGRAFEKDNEVPTEQEDNLSSNQVIPAASHHVFQPPVTLQTKQETKAKNGMQKSFSHDQKKPSIIQRSLVDYESDDEEDNASAGSKTSSVKSANSQRSAKKRKVDSDSKIFDVPDQSPPKKLMSKDISSAGSKTSKNFSATSTSSDSDQSDMETAIPTPLTSDVVPVASIPVVNTKDSSLSPAEMARKLKNREKKAKAKERKRREKEAAASASASADIDADRAPVILGVQHVKKLKDRLLDANGN